VLALSRQALLTLDRTKTARVAIEHASTCRWGRYVGTSGRIIGVKAFGVWFEPDHAVAATKELLGRR
jgi:transketolase